MIKKILLALLLIFNLFALLHLISPTPSIPPLPYSALSNEPGDTIQISNVSAYYTNLTRTEVINFYKANYNGAFRIILNHPPEKARDIIRDTIQSYYLQEFVLPFKDSLYVNGYEWENDVFTKPEKRIKNKLIFNGKEYKAKITLRHFPTSIPQRLLSFYFIQGVIILSVIIYSSYLLKKKNEK